MIFRLRQLQEKCIEQDRPLYMLFVDFSKAFDTVGRTRLWQLLRKNGCPKKFTTMIEALHTGMMANVSVGGEVSESFSVKNGVKQGCVLARMLFSIFLSAMLDEAFRDMGDGIYIQSRQSADLFNVAHFRAKTKTTPGSWILMRELLFADDSALVAHSAEEMQKIVDAFSDTSKKFGLKINIKKTEVLYQTKSTRTREVDSMVDGNKLNSVLEFTYHQVMDALKMKYRGGWPRLMHLSADYARDSGTTTMYPCGLKARYTVQSCCPLSYTEPRPGQCTDNRWKSCMPSWCDICVRSWG